MSPLLSTQQPFPRMNHLDVPPRRSGLEADAVRCNPPDRAEPSNEILPCISPKVNFGKISGVFCISGRDSLYGS